MNQKHTWLQYSLLCSLLLLTSKVAHAQITPDNTLGAESSRLTPNVQIKGAAADSISGGAQRGSNLFHSFSQFNVGNGQRVYFVNPVGIQNILTRVTGKEASNILGTLGVNGSANLFLLNPNGILFGPNARLDVGGSFVGTSASAFRFGEQGEFSATNPEAPPLLIVNPSALFFNQLNPGAIANVSNATAGTTPTGDKAFGLRVADGQNLLLLGGTVENAGGLNAFGGRVEIGAVAGVGTVQLNLDSSLSFPSDLPRADVFLTNRSLIDVAAGDGGSVTINARNLAISQGSGVQAGIRSGLGTPDSKAGDIVLNTSEALRIEERSVVQNSVFPELSGFSSGTGNSGDIRITAGSLSMLDRSQLSASTFGQGNAGSIIIQARDRVSLDNNARLTANTSAKGNAGSIIIQAGNRVSLDNDAFISSLVTDKGVGNGGDIRISTGSLTIAGAAQLDSSTFGQGNAGDIIIDARDTVLFSGVKGNLASGILTTVERQGNGNGGDIRISADSVIITDGADLSTYTTKKGNAGNIDIEARNQVTLSNRSSLSSNTFAQGSAGNISIDVGNQVNLDNISYISSVVGENARGNGGTISIKTGSLSMTASQLQTSTFGRGDAGDVIINALGDISLSGFVLQEGLPVSSAIFSAVENTGIGNAGDIRINSKTFSMADNATLKASTQGQGNSGNIFINASDRVSLDSRAIISNIVGNVLNPGQFGDGKGGTIGIDTGSLLMINGAQLQASTFGRGDAGDIIINARDSFLASGFGQFEDLTRPTAAYSISADNSNGNGGNIRVNTGSLFVENGARFSVSTSGEGRAGNIAIDARDAVVVDGVSKIGYLSQLSTATDDDAKGVGGTITVNTNSFRVSNGGLVTAQTTSAFQGGDVTINANNFAAIQGGRIITTATNQGQAGSITLNADSINLSGRNQRSASGLFANTTSTASGQGGNIQVNVRQLNVSDYAQISVNSQGSAIAGDININANTVRLSDRANIVAETASQNGGNISIKNANLLLLRRNSLISATAAQGGNGGNITMNAQFIVAVPKENSDIFANAFQGRGGNITINTQGLFGIVRASFPTPQSDITASSELGVQGQIFITQPEVERTSGLIELPTQVVDATTQIAQICPRSPNAKPLGEFIITGRGSLQPNPLEPLAGTPNLSPLATLDSQNSANVPQTSPSIAVTPTAPAIVEAQGWVKDRDGNITLVAFAPQATPSSRPAATVCPVSK
ncbi:MAG: filamentous hemagglutinin N-terminal domain-containing protein [Brasilonema angustatum HA4187-MV1]|jgi:filamentous hemagglutinin family protein|nr:filamentous hemagglutinin N-terminal domain-containing protein [Brasilonema angustatum HA4187-MV1]